MEITDIHVWDMGNSFSANIAIDDKWLLQLGDDGRFSIPEPDEAFWRSERAQSSAVTDFDPDEVAELLGIPTTIRELRAMGAEDMI